MIYCVKEKIVSEPIWLAARNKQKFAAIEELLFFVDILKLYSHANTCDQHDDCTTLQLAVHSTGCCFVSKLGLLSLFSFLMF